MDKRRVLYFILVAAFVVGAVLLIVGGVLLWHHYEENHPGTDVDQVTDTYAFIIDSLLAKSTALSVYVRGYPAL